MIVKAHKEMGSLASLLRIYPDIEGLEYIEAKIREVAVKYTIDVPEPVEHFLLGMRYLRTDSLDLALDEYICCIEHADTCDYTIIALCHFLIATIYFTIDSPKLAATHFKIALDNEHRLEPGTLAWGLTNMSGFYCSIKQYEKAYEIGTRCKESSIESQADYTYAVCQLNLGYALAHLERPLEALEHVECALAIVQPSENKRLIGMCHSYFALAHAKVVDTPFDVVSEHFIKAKEYLSGASSTADLVENNIAYAKYLLSNGQEKEAMSICDDIDTEFKESLTSTNEVDILSIRSNAYRKSEKWQQLAETQHALTNVLSGKVAQLNEQMAQLVTNDVQQAAKQQEQLVNGKVFENLGAINTIGQTIASSEHLTQALPEIYELVKGVFPVYEFGIALYDKQDDRLDYNYFFDENGYITPISVICSNQDAIGSYVVMTQKTVHLNSATYETISTFINANKHFNDDAIKNEMETISLIIAPIMLGKEVMGILSIQSNQGDQYHTYHKRLFEQLANFIAIALNNLKQKEHLLIANQQLKKLSITDPLTGLQNRSQLNEIYRKLRSESVRGNETLSFILIDIDNYKQFNDDYGHNVGDKALVTLAKILKNVFVHESTNLFRYGGDEFLILLRGVTTVELEQRLQRLNLEISTVDIANGKQEFTLSIGAVSSFVDQDTTFRTLFDKADEALYEVKSNGRNHFKLITP